MKRIALALGISLGIVASSALAHTPKPPASPASANATDAVPPCGGPACAAPPAPVAFLPPQLPPNTTPTSCPAPFPVEALPQEAAYGFVRPNPVANNCPYFAAARMFGGYDFLTSKWQAADSDDRPSVEQELRTALKKDFEVRLAQDEEEAKRLESQVKELQAKLKARREKEDEIVDFHLQELLRDEQGLGWSQDARALYPGPSFPIEYAPRPVAEYYEPASVKPVSSIRISRPTIAPVGASSHQ